MKMTYYRGEHPNFGDELNAWLWPQLLPNFFDDAADSLFLGIGSIIGTKFDPAAKKIVFGAGFASEYDQAPDLSDGKWDIFFVRGPRTAKALNICPSLAIGDGAILLRSVVDLSRKDPKHISFMPHWESFYVGDWRRVCDIAGIHLIDPRQPVDKVIDELLQSRLVIAEAMHGAIVADALRTPWAPLTPINPLHRNKWLDWAEALDIDLRPYRLLPSTIEESNHAVAGRFFLSRMRRGVAFTPPLRWGADCVLAHLAARRLQQIAKMPPSLSEDRKIEEALEMMQSKLHKLQLAYPR
ncbi:polysaccharide pyruvyl transferase family protein [Methylocapsa aurea]|uniref:polysaccharide pyruvyl transferase family protein n=1 Tax=Methylocapsa aurea TaxID=663610 RepID=UPI00055FCFA9|nr:polysaccharide pyruvyl transferase family protein [Methylocapsa aurea]